MNTTVKVMHPADRYNWEKATDEILTKVEPTTNDFNGAMWDIVEILQCRDLIYLTHFLLRGHVTTIYFSPSSREYNKLFKLMTELCNNTHQRGVELTSDNQHFSVTFKESENEYCLYFDFI